MGNYVTVTDIRDEGVTTEEASDSRIDELILLAEEYIEKMTGRYFYEKSKTIILYGQDSKVLLFPIPIITVNQITVNGYLIDTVDYTVYNRYEPDDRENPKIEFEFTIQDGDKIEVNGSFGYVQEDKTTPLMISRAVKKLVIREIPLLTDQDGQEQKKRSRIVEEQADDYSYKLAEVVVRGDLTGDFEIDGVIINYRRPPEGGVI